MCKKIILVLIIGLTTILGQVIIAEQNEGKSNFLNLNNCKQVWE